MSCFPYLNWDMFASYENNKLPFYTSWGPDPFLSGVNAFTIDWHEIHPYCFPPFSLISHTLHHLKKTQSRAIMVVPDWPTAHWFPAMLELFNKHPMQFSPWLTLPQHLLQNLKSPPPRCSTMLVVSIQHLLRKCGLSSISEDVFIKARSEQTYKKTAHSIWLWLQFCKWKQICYILRRS